MKTFIGRGTNSPCELDVTKLISSRMLIQASSGGGKTQTTRLLLERTNGQVQHIVLDVEGEYATLRDEYDYLLVGKEGDIQINVAHAATLARRILELQVDVIIDLYELVPYERILFVKRFLTEMMNVPKNLYHPVLVVLDEAHVFAPEGSSAESSNAVKHLASAGRKRGFCLVACTQRLSKLHKDVAAEQGNKLIGLSNMDIDRKRSATELGFSTAHDVMFLRDLKPGQFYAVGPAFTHKGVELVQIDRAKTKEAPVGINAAIKLKPRDKINRVLKELKDLPQQAAIDINDKESMRRQITELQREIKELKTQPAITVASNEALILRKQLENRDAQIKKLSEMIAKLQDLWSKHSSELGAYLKELKLDAVVASRPLKAVKPAQALEQRVARPAPEQVQLPDQLHEFHRLPKCERQIMNFLSSYPHTSFDKTIVAIMSGYAITGGGFSNALGNLASQNMIVRENGNIRIAFMPAESTPFDPQGALDHWEKSLGKCERLILGYMREHPNRTITKNEVAISTGYEPGGGGFGNAIGHLCSLGLIERVGTGEIRMNPAIYEIP